MLHRFEILSGLETFTRTALLCCRLATSRLRSAACWQLALLPRGQINKVDLQVTNTIWD